MAVAVAAAVAVGWTPRWGAALVGAALSVLRSSALRSSVLRSSALRSSALRSSARRGHRRRGVIGVARSAEHQQYARHHDATIAAAAAISAVMACLVDTRASLPA